ncbi:HupE/UreJ family protein [Robiginitalea sp. IMCC43444]|uniref:HupE/UreJ family protein n=1 Tax=Robiginitalea sp. IMCC43444 TaxID=3459121 RepID=UPI0040413E38
MQDFWFYGELGLFHVLDLQGYDHVLFLIALALPFGFRQWKKLLALATLFTIAHCLSLGLAAFGIISVDAAIVEFLIPVTIFLTALFNLFRNLGEQVELAFRVHLFSTGLFGLIHGLGFSNYFRMLMSGSSEKAIPLLGFAAGIELAQVLVLCMVLSVSLLALDLLGVRKKAYLWGISILILGISAMLAFQAWPA